MNTPKNGAGAANGATTSKPATLPQNNTVKTTVPVVTLPKKEPKAESEQLPLEDRILKIQMLSDLTAKREKLVDSLKKITSLKFSSDGREERLTIEDEKEEWITTNSELLKEVVAVIKAHIQKKIEAVTAQIVL